MRAIAMGSAGIIGSTWADALQTLDFEVLVLDDLGRGGIVNSNDNANLIVRMRQLVAT